MPAIGHLASVTLDAPDPRALASFYSALTGWQTLHASDDFVFIGTPDGAQRLGFQRAAGFRSPSWPGDDKQMHLDFGVADIAVAVRDLTAVGATKPEYQPGGDKWVVLLDPAGHPFCVTTAV
ncbi:VOC family protein [Streptomyces sp. P6-2-1]|uniref:VOC family protein n=1 Tax=Streptomyces sp. P6-2-1 TaxID=3422591 RepID=UPI003D36FA9D